MNKKMIIIGAILLIGVPLVIATDALNRIQIGNAIITQEIAETIVEIPTIAGKTIFSEIQIRSTEGLQNYISEAKKRLAQANDAQEYIAVITFAQPLSKNELDEVIQKNGLKPMSVRFVSQPTGGGQLPYPLTNEDLAMLSESETRIMKSFLEAKKNDPELIVPQDFKLLKGFVSIYVKEKGSKLKEMKDPTILLVDVGPIEHQIAGKIGITFPLKDIFYEWETFGDGTKQ